MEKKYELLMENKVVIEGHELYQIKAVRDFATIECGQLGGFIENEANLSHSGICWIHKDSAIFDKASVYEDVQIFNTTNGLSFFKGTGVVVDGAPSPVLSEAYEFLLKALESLMSRQIPAGINGMGMPMIGMNTFGPNGINQMYGNMNSGWYR